MEEKLNKKEDFVLLYGIGIATGIAVVIFGVFYGFAPGKRNTIPAALNSGEQAIVNPIPQPIQKTEKVLLTEKKVKVTRDVKLNNDGSFTIVAYLSGLSNIPEGIILNDFHEEIRLGKRVNALNSKIEPLNGYLFPMDDNVTVSTYGPGPASKKSTSLNITLLDLNFDYKTKDAGLYELTFFPDASVEEFIFPSTEIRSGKYILEFKEEKI